MNNPEIEPSERAGRALERATGDRPVPADEFGTDQQRLADVSTLNPPDFDQWMLGLSGSETLALYDHLEYLAQQHRRRAGYADDVQQRLRAHHEMLAKITSEVGQRDNGPSPKIAATTL